VCWFCWNGDREVAALTHTGDLEAAGWIRAEVERLGGPFRVHSETLLELFAAPDFDGEHAGRISRSLADLQLVTDPADLGGHSTAGVVTISARDQTKPPEQDRIEAEPPATPVGPDPATVLATQAAALPAQALTAGVLVPGLVAAVVGGAVWWPFALLFLALAGGVWVAFRYARFWLARIFLWPLKSLWATGFLLAAVPMLLVSVLASAAVVSPVADKRAADERRDDARALIVQGTNALRDGDVDRAQQALDDARDKDPNISGDDGLESAIASEQDRRDRETAQIAEYEKAKETLESGDSREALPLLLALGSFRDSEQLAGQARRDLAARQLRSAKRLFAEGQFADARAAAERSNATRPTKAAQNLRAAASKRLAERRVAARALARKRAAERKAKQEAKRKAAAEARRQKKAAEQQREQQESAPAVPDTPSAPSGSCGDISATDFPVPPGDPRDRDGDGIACES